MREEAFRRALKGSLSGVTFDPARQRAVLADMKGEKPVKKKMTLAIALVMATLLLGGTALAAGLGLFGQFAETADESRVEELNRLEKLAQNIDETKTVQADGKDVTLTLRQAYCDGTRLFYSYELTGGGLGDGADLADGTPTMIVESGEQEREDGTKVGYQTVELPEGVNVGATLDILLRVSGVDVPFTVPVTDNGMTMTGGAAFATYTAEATLRKTDVAVKGTVTLNCPAEWTANWTMNGDDSEGSEGSGTRKVLDYVLVADGKTFANHDGGFYSPEEGVLVIGLQFNAVDRDEYTLVPVYIDGGEEPGEGFSIGLLPMNE